MITHSIGIQDITILSQEVEFAEVTYNQDGYIDHIKAMGRGGEIILNQCEDSFTLEAILLINHIHANMPKYTIVKGPLINEEIMIG